jgi:hypothetical protein
VEILPVKIGVENTPSRVLPNGHVMEPGISTAWAANPEKRLKYLPGLEFSYGPRFFGPVFYIFSIIFVVLKNYDKWYENRIRCQNTVVILYLPFMY